MGHPTRRLSTSMRMTLSSVKWILLVMSNEEVMEAEVMGLRYASRRAENDL